MKTNINPNNESATHMSDASSVLKSKPIENIKKYNKSEKFWMQSVALIKRNLMAYSASAIAGFAVATYTQNQMREVPGIGCNAQAKADNLNNTQKLALKIENREQGVVLESRKKIEEDTIKKERDSALTDVTDWLKNKINKTVKIGGEVKEFAADPKSYVQDTEAYMDAMSKYYSIIRFTDYTAFWLPFLTILVMLGGYISRKIKEQTGDVVQQGENKKMLDKINELVVSANNMKSYLEAQASSQTERIERDKTASEESLKEILTQQAVDREKVKNLAAQFAVVLEGVNLNNPDSADPDIGSDS